MVDTLTPDICVIGGGSGGLSVASAAAAFGVPVVLIEKGKMCGDRRNDGGVASKALLAAAKHATEKKRVTPFGLSIPREEIDFAKVHAHVQEVIAAVAPNDSKERLAALGVRVVAGAARFKDKGTVIVGETEIKARRFVIATGSSPAVPDIPGLADVPYLTVESIFSLTRCPAHLIVIGADAVGIELAQAHRRLGAAVTVLDAATPLAHDDPECAAAVLAQLRQEGVTIRSGVAVARVARNGETIEITLADGETIAGSDLLLASGRRPNLDGLDLQAARVKFADKGVTVGRSLKTSNRRVYAIGDAAGGHFTHTATYQAGIVVRNALFRLPTKVNEDAVPRVTFTDPELAHVGLTEIQASERHKVIRVLRWPYYENDRAQAERTTQGHVKIITKKNGLILGCTIVGAQAGEQIVTWGLALSRGLNIRAMTEIVMPYPTLSEAGRQAAYTYFSPGLNNPRVRKLIGFLRRFG